MVVGKVEYHIIVKENEDYNDYSIEVNGDSVLVIIVVNDFNKINMYKNIVLQQLKHINHKKPHSSKVVEQLKESFDYQKADDMGANYSLGDGFEYF